MDYASRLLHFCEKILFGQMTFRSQKRPYLVFYQPVVIR